MLNFSNITTLAINLIYSITILISILTIKQMPFDIFSTSQTFWVTAIVTLQLFVTPIIEQKAAFGAKPELFALLHIVSDSFICDLFKEMFTYDQLDVVDIDWLTALRFGAGNGSLLVGKLCLQEPRKTNFAEMMATVEQNIRRSDVIRTKFAVFCDWFA